MATKISNIITKNASNGAARAMLYAVGFKKPDFDKYIVGIGNMAFDGNPCNMHTHKLSQIVQNSINTDNMKGLKYTSVGVSDGITMGTKGMRYSLPSRELIADSIESMSNAHYYDGNILIPSCDKNMPGAIMGLSRTNKPSIVIYGGSILPGRDNDSDIDIVNAFQSYGEMLNKKITCEQRETLLSKCCPGPGSCGGMYTANTMACAIEAMGMSLPFSSSNPAMSNEKILECQNISNYMYNLLKNDIKPSDIITKKALENAITLVISLGGSTNAVIHLLAIARTLNIDLVLDDFTRIGKNVPVIANLKPHGKYLMHDVYKAGGTPKVLKYLLEQNLLHGDCMTVTGKTLAENLLSVSTDLDKKIFDINNPLKESSHINILYGTLSPSGCVAKITGKEGVYFKGKAKVYNSEDDFIVDLEKNVITENMIIVLRYQGPKGGPGMPEMLKATSAIIGYGIKDKIAFVTDGRFSGGSHGFIIGHITPEAYLGGPIALVKDNDIIEICAKNNKINLLVDEKELENRKQEWKIPSEIINNIPRTSYLNKFRLLVKQTDDGCIC